MKKMEFYGETNMGMLRDNNEDAFIAQHIWDENYILCVAIDGVGGYEGGEVAAQIAQELIPKHLSELLRDNPLEALKSAVVEANNRIAEERKHDSSRPNMGCVLSAGIIELQNNIIDIVHVGDSRIYRYENGNLEKITHDHSLVGYREEIGELSEEEAMNHPQRNVIDRLLGEAFHATTDRNFFDAARFPLSENTQLLFCSDGLTDLVTSAEIREILDQPISIKEKTKRLIDKANQKGGKDNITVVLAVGENRDAKPQTTVVEPPKPKAQPTPADNAPAPCKKDKRCKRWWIWLLAALLILAAFIGGNILGTRGVGCVPDNNQKGNCEDTVAILKKDVDSLKAELNAAYDTIALRDSALAKINAISSTNNTPKMPTHNKR